jgi:hypothetical protein
MKTLMLLFIANPRIIFGGTFVIIAFILFYLNGKYGLFKDDSTQPLNKRTYSFARVQLAWWTLIILSCTASITFYTGKLPDLFESTLWLLGITGMTTGAARLIDISNQGAGKINDAESKGLLLDILSSGVGVDMHRLQCLFFNIGVGGYFIYQALKFNAIPDLSSTYLGLLGISSGLYVFMKNKE